MKQVESYSFRQVVRPVEFIEPTLKLLLQKSIGTMIHLSLLFLLVLLTISHSVPKRPTKWHGRTSVNHNASLTAACGEATTVLENPWSAILWIENDFQCGATLLEHNLAITAAHCVINQQTEHLHLFYGRSFQPDSSNEDQGFIRYGGKMRIEAVRIHPSYNHRSPLKITCLLYTSPSPRDS